MQVLGYASFLLFFSQNALLELALHCLDRQNGTIITHTLSLKLPTLRIISGRDHMLPNKQLPTQQDQLNREGLEIIILSF